MRTINVFILMILVHLVNLNSLHGAVKNYVDEKIQNIESIKNYQQTIFSSKWNKSIEDIQKINPLSYIDKNLLASGILSLGKRHRAEKPENMNIRKRVFNHIRKAAKQILMKTKIPK
ncbi:hypothetical protein HZS_77 [Henneguya salminicola]|nr:hypothetical protein HZS_77 [Henneguya salminicola]